MDIDDLLDTLRALPAEYFYLLLFSAFFPAFLAFWRFVLPLLRTCNRPARTRPRVL
jgi:hypothetical protein